MAIQSEADIPEDIIINCNQFGLDQDRSTKAQSVDAAIQEAKNIHRSVHKPNGVAVYVPSNYQNYDASSVDFYDSIQVYTEGQKEGVISITSYGAVNDNENEWDQSYALQAALDCSVGDKRIVHIPSGVYRFVRQVYIKHDGTTLQGEGDNTVLLIDKDWTGEPNVADTSKPDLISNGQYRLGADIGKLYAQKNVTIADLKIEGEDVVQQSTVSRPISLYGGGGRTLQNVHVEGVTIHDCWGMGVSVFSAKGVQIKDVEVDKWRRNYGIQVKGCKDVDVEGCLVKNGEKLDGDTTDINGIFIGDDELIASTNVVVKNTTVSQLEGGAFTTESNNKPVGTLKVQNCDINGASGYGVKIKGTRFFEIVDTTIEDNEDGIMIRAEHAHSISSKGKTNGTIEIKNCVVKNNSEDGIGSHSSDGVGNILIKDTNVEGSGKDGITFHNNGFIELENVLVKDSQERGLDISSNEYDSLYIDGVEIENPNKGDSVTEGNKVAVDGISRLKDLSITFEDTQVPSVGIFLDLHRQRVDGGSFIGEGITVADGPDVKYEIVRDDGTTYEYNRPIVAIRDRNIEVQGEQAPTSGFWMVGDIVWNSDIQGSQPKGWICTQKGEPGVWQSFQSDPP